MSVSVDYVNDGNEEGAIDLRYCYLHMLVCQIMPFYATVISVRQTVKIVHCDNSIICDL